MGDAKKEETKPAFNFGAGLNFGGTKTAAKEKTPEEKEKEKAEFQTKYKDIADKKVGDLIKEYQAKLEEQVKAFETEAAKIGKADREIFDCLYWIEFLEEQVDDLAGKQEELRKEAESLCEKQKTLIEKMKEEGKNAVHTEDKRQKMWDNAHRLGAEFLNMEDQIKRLAEQYDGRRSEASSQSEVGKITKVANHHLSSLMWMDEVCTDMEKKLKAIMDS